MRCDTLTWLSARMGDRNSLNESLVQKIFFAIKLNSSKK
jgi:hypothetical protein